MSLNRREIIQSIIKHGYFLKVSGNSMYPVIKDGDRAYFIRKKFAKIKVNDLVLIKKQNLFITHRVIFKAQKYLITKGDNSLKSDGKIYAKNFIAKLVKVVREKKTIIINHFFLMQSTLYFKEIIIIKKAFDSAKINYLFLRGLPFYFYYGKIDSTQTYTNCDVLIDKEQLEIGKNILKEQGFKKIKRPLSRIHEKFKKKEIKIVYIKIINNFLVFFNLYIEPFFLMSEIGKLEELYPQKLLNQLTIDFFETKQTIKIKGYLFKIPDKKYLILYLSLNFFYYNYCGALRINFLDRVIRKSNLSSKQWDKLAAIINKYYLYNFTYASFYIAKKLYKAQVPNKFQKIIQPRIYNYKFLLSALSKSAYIFSDQSRIYAGIERFKLLYCLSPNYWYRKILVFIKPIVLYTIIWANTKKIINKIKNDFKFYISRNIYF
jgi:signal peptidase I